MLYFSLQFAHRLNNLPNSRTSYMCVVFILDAECIRYLMKHLYVELKLGLNTLSAFGRYFNE